MNEILDIKANRACAKYSPGEMFLRLLWIFGKVLFRFSPRPFFGWRCLVLKCFGAKVGNHVNIYNTAVICFPWNFHIGDWSSIGEGALIYNLGPVIIGSQSTVSHRAHLCAGTHDYRKADLPLLRPPIVIEDQVLDLCGCVYRAGPDGR